MMKIQAPDHRSHEKEELFSRAPTVTGFTKMQIDQDNNVVIAYRLRLPDVPVIRNEYS
jgi:hypothetical protein